MAIYQITAPSIEPISLAEARAHCHIDGTDEDTMLAIYIAAAREKAEALTGRALITQTWVQTLDEFPADEIELLKPGVLSIVSVAYVDIDGTPQTVSNTDYSLDARTLPGWLLPVGAFEWPQTDVVVNAVTITMTCGFGPAATDVPASIRNWMLLTIGYLHEQRAAIDSAGRASAIPSRFVDSLLDKHVVYGV